MKHYVNCTLTHDHIRPQDFGMEAIGHFGFFKKGGEERLWPGLVERITAITPHT
jgi:predicted alpha/beta hydrolase